MTRETCLGLVVCMALVPGCQVASPSEAQAPVAIAPPAAAQAHPHPLDPLTADEIRVAVETARTDDRLKEATLPSILRHDAPKADVLAWQPGQAPVRQARLQAMVANTTYEVLVDVVGRRLVSVTERPGAEPSMTMSEIMATSVVLTNAEFVAGLRQRGVTDLAKVFCAPFSAGYYGRSEREGNRLVKVGCFDTRRSTTNLFGWPIERLYAVVDLRARAVLSVTDQGAVPIREGDGNYDEAAIGALRPARKPTVLAQPEGSNVQIAGHEVSWGKWRFHVGIDPRVGTVVSLARWQDTSGPRSVLYQGYLSEMFVPYMDTDYGWQSRTYFDTGEYGAGAPGDAAQGRRGLPGVRQLPAGRLQQREGRALHHRQTRCASSSGAVAIRSWRHFEAINQTYEGRANVELVVADGGDDRQLRLPVRLGVQRRRRNRDPCRRHRHRRAQGRGDTTDERWHGGGGYALRHAGRAEPRRRQSRPLLQLQARPRRRRSGQQLQPRRLPPGAAARRLAAPEHLRGGTAESPPPRRRRSSTSTAAR